MSSENASSVTDRKEINVKLQSGKMTFEGVPSLSIDISEPRLNIGKLYDALFKEVDAPITISLNPDLPIKQDKNALAVFNSVKSIVDAACESINEKLPAVLERLRSANEQLADAKAE